MERESSYDTKHISTSTQARDLRRTKPVPASSHQLLQACTGEQPARTAHGSWPQLVLFHTFSYLFILLEKLRFFYNFLAFLKCNVALQESLKNRNFSSFLEVQRGENYKNQQKIS